jgi:hypothetical protein
MSRLVPSMRALVSPVVRNTSMAGHEGVLEFRDRPDDGEEQPADRGGGVDALVQHHQIHPAGLQLLGQLDQMLQRPAKPIELRDDELIALPHDQQNLIKLGAPGQLARCLVDEDLIATGCGQRVVLGICSPPQSATKQLNHLVADWVWCLVGAASRS